MYSKLFARRSCRGATVWMFDWIRPLLVASVIGPGLAGGIVWLAWSPWWWCGLAVVVLLPLARLRIAASDPATLRVTEVCALLPYRRRRVLLAQLHACHGADSDAGGADPHDALAADGWELPCRDADAVVTWLRAAGAELAMPEAMVKR